MLSRRKMLTAAGISTVGLGAAACGGDGAGDDSATPLDLDVADEDISGEITLLTPEYANAARATLDEDILGSFKEKYPDVTVTVDQVAWDKLNEKLTTSIAGGLVADVIMAGVGWTPPFAHKGIFAELPADFVDPFEIDETVLTSSVHDGKYYSVPQMLDCRFIAYHPEQFEQAGISEPPADMEELASAAKELTRDGVLGFDLFTTDIRQAWIHLLFAFGGQLFSEDGMTPMMQEEPGLLATQWILDQMEAGSVDFNLQAAEGQPTPFQQGTAAMQLVGTGIWTQWKDMTPELTEEGAVGTFLLPGGNGADPIMFQGGTLISVGERSRNKSAAAALVNHMMDPEILGISNAAMGKVPPTADIPDNEEIQGNLLAGFALENLDRAGAAEGGSPAWMEIRGNMQPLIEGCLTGQTTPEEMLAEMEAISNDAIGRL